MAHNEKSNTMERLQELIAGENYEKADREFRDYLSRGGQYDDMLAIYDAAIGQGMGNCERIWAAICQGLGVNPENYELYVQMGDYYLDENREQSWLCYEHALSCCKNQEDRAQIAKMQRQLTEDCGVFTGRTAVVIWCHGGADSVRRCVESVRRTMNGCAGQMVAVADQCEPAAQEWLRQQKDMILVERTVDWESSQVWEKGIAAAWADADCLLMDSDVILPAHALFWLRMSLYGSDAAGTVGSMSCFVINSRLSGLVKEAGMDDLNRLARRMNVPMRYPCEPVPWMRGAAVLIRRQALKEAGIPCELPTSAGFMSRDYGRKVENAGYRNLLCENSFLLHQRAETDGLDDAGKACCASAGETGDRSRRFLLFYAGNERGYYQDTKYFSDQIAKALRHRGHQTFICDLARGSHDAGELEAYLAKGVDAALTIDGEAIQDEGLWQLWNQLGALVVNILVDPPFHMDLWPHLENPGIERYLLLCTDENHVEYVKRYFPQVKHVEFMPHGGTPVETSPIPWKEKRVDLLFSGTYTKPERFMNVMKRVMKPEDFNIYAGIGERILQETSLSVDQAVAETLFSDNVPLTPGKINETITGTSLLDAWVRMVMRERVVTALVEGGVDLHVLGAGWQDCPGAESGRIHMLSEERIPLGDTLQWMDNSKICLNVMPWFKAGSHERVFNAMLRSSLVLTDSSSYLQQHFRDRESIVYYSLKELEKLPDIVRSLLKNQEQAESIAANGYARAEAFTWEHYAENLLAKMEKLF